MVERRWTSLACSASSRVMSSGSLLSARKASVMIWRISVRTPAPLPATASARFRVASASSIFFCLASACPRSLRAGASTRLSPAAALATSRNSPSARSKWPRESSSRPSSALTKSEPPAELGEALVVALGALEVLEIEAERQQGARRLLQVDAGLEQGQRLLQLGAGARLVAAIRLELSERQHRRRLLGLVGDGLLVGADGVVVAPVLLVDAGERHPRRPGVRPPGGGALLEVVDELLQVAVALAVELPEPLERERLARLREHDAGVAGDERVGAGAALGPPRPPCRLLRSRLAGAGLDGGARPGAPRLGVRRLLLPAARGVEVGVRVPGDERRSGDGEGEAGGQEVGGAPDKGTARGGGGAMRG